MSDRFANRAGKLASTTVKELVMYHAMTMQSEVLWDIRDSLKYCVENFGDTGRYTRPTVVLEELKKQLELVEATIACTEQAVEYGGKR